MFISSLSKTPASCLVRFLRAVWRLVTQYELVMGGGINWTVLLLWLDTLSDHLFTSLLRLVGKSVQPRMNLQLHSSSEQRRSLVCMTFRLPERDRTPGGMSMSATKGNLIKTSTSFLVGGNAVSKSHHIFFSQFGFPLSIWVAISVQTVLKKKRVLISPRFHLAKRCRITDLRCIRWIYRHADHGQKAQILSALSYIIWYILVQLVHFMQHYHDDKCWMVCKS